MMSLITIGAAVIAACLAILVWRAARVSPAGHLKNVTVSRHWLMEHQGEDGS
jgi:hypothetical protein